MNIISIKENQNFLEEYIKLCSLEWGNLKSKEELNVKVKTKVDEIILKKEDKLISVLGLIDYDKLVGFISLFKYDGEERKDLTPWYATMYIKKEFRGKRYSEILNAAILKQATILGYDKVYLKSIWLNIMKNLEQKN